MLKQKRKRIMKREKGEKGRGMKREEGKRQWENTTTGKGRTCIRRKTEEERKKRKEGKDTKRKQGDIHRSEKRKTIKEVSKKKEHE